MGVDAHSRLVTEVGLLLLTIGAPGIRRGIAALRARQAARQAA
jgi:hypothetical protein